PRPGFVPPVAVENLTRDHVERGIVGPGGAFRVGIPSDVGDRIRISFQTPAGPRVIEVTSLGEGLGIPRNH
ncbi:MAG: hypothetical protein K8I02_09180, partial [Candidatus Methylomirabilis sp.]|nr:hypothetical protein [Deltaproteobacteria bacterium]